MTVALTQEEKGILSGEMGAAADKMALEMVVKAADMLGARDLIPITSAHIDCCIYLGDAGVLFCEKLVDGGGRVRVPSTTNVGGLNLLKPDQCSLPVEKRKMAFRLMQAHQKMGCQASFTCAPYQAGARPAFGSQNAWAESNAVGFINTVLGARTNRYGDFLDIACAISGRAPNYGLHLDENRRGQILIDAGHLSGALKGEAAFYPVLGALIGRLAGDAVPVIDGLPGDVSEDRLKALCAGAAAKGAVALIHVVGVTPEAPDLAAAFQGQEPEERILLTQEMVTEARDQLSDLTSGTIDCVAVGSPHFSLDECLELLRLADGRRFAAPVYVCLGRHTVDGLERAGFMQGLLDIGVELVVDTCIAVTPILPQSGGVMMTNSAKFAHYAMGTTGYKPVFGSLPDCVESAVRGEIMRDPGLWS